LTAQRKGLAGARWRRMRMTVTRYKLTIYLKGEDSPQKIVIHERISANRTIEDAVAHNALNGFVVHNTYIPPNQITRIDFEPL
jgi:hypothetical protein